MNQQRKNCLPIYILMHQHLTHRSKKKKKSAPPLGKEPHWKGQFIGPPAIAAREYYCHPDTDLKRRGQKGRRLNNFLFLFKGKRWGGGIFLGSLVCLFVFQQDLWNTTHCRFQESWGKGSAILLKLVSIQKPSTYIASITDTKYWFWYF